MKKIISVVGARPQFIKLASVSKEIRKYFNEIIVHTGQHYDYNMSKSFFDELGIPKPDYDLEVGSGNPGYQMAQILMKFEDILLQEKPDLVVVFGDTNSTAAAAICAAKNNFLVAHVEAGLRENNKFVPEEVNKLLTDAISDIFFSPTDTGVNNLAREGKSENVHNTGDVGIDLIVKNQAKIEASASVLTRYNLVPNEYFYATCHRAENTDKKENLEGILRVFCEVDKQVIFPMHPRTKKSIEKFGLQDMLSSKNIICVDPIGFFDTQCLIKNAFMCLTDSGGVIKETYFHKVPGIIIDTQTEWIETVSEGWNILCGPNFEKIMYAIDHFTKPDIHTNCVGNGTAAAQIVEYLRKFLSKPNE
jgi:UDP-N-acetylglucosamine 2-epimerase